MAFLDFLNKDIGGYAQGPMATGTAGVPRAGLTYNDIVRAALQYGSKPGSSAPMFAGMIPQSAPTPTQPAQPGTLLDSGQQKKDDGFGNTLLNALASYFLG